MEILYLCVFVVLAIQSDAASDSSKFTESKVSLEKLNRVLLCLNTDAREQINKLGADIPYAEMSSFDIDYISDHSCQREIETDDDQTILFVIAPKPFNLSSNIPMYFYDTPFLTEEQCDKLPNGLTSVQEHWQLLKDAFTFYIAKHGWRRIAVVSDNSPYSEAIEKQLVDEFKHKKLIYNVQRCKVAADNSCDFDEALNILKDQKAVVIIANIESPNSISLAESADKLGMKSSQYVWLMRDWPFEDTTSQNFENIISITMTAMPRSECNGVYSHEDPHLNSIRRGFFLITDSVEDIYRRDNIEQFYGSIMEGINKRKCGLAKAFIRRFTTGRPVFVDSFKIWTYSGVLKPDPDNYQNSSDVTVTVSEPACLLKTSSFSNPCYDIWLTITGISLLMLCVAVFIYRILREKIRV